ncbi:MAG TPA: phosphoribosylaminoimidazolesuccinocarboxamide synthase [Dehalococcoidia bacterium]|nr:phosphoribosylaminoimidazolesuccinocarboxamide synthase [Dehalococcoidia bacterium]
MTILLDAILPLPVFGKGKVRDTYDLGDALLIVVTDRISAFDVVLPCGIPDKGAVLNQIAAFWFEKTTHLVPNHVIKTVNSLDDIKQYVSSIDMLPLYLSGRSMIVKKANVIPVECVVRGYLSGSAWEEYKKQGTISGLKQPTGLRESEELPQPLFTPTTKAQTGHDMPLTWQEMEKLIGTRLANEVREKSLSVYSYAREYARQRDLIIADTKFEFGIIDGDVCLVDEVLTPDSSRFWAVKNYAVGRSQPSFDKQPVRDWLEKSGWNKQPPAPMLPEDVIQATSIRYRKAYRLITGRELQYVSG